MGIYKGNTKIAGGTYPNDGGWVPVNATLTYLGADGSTFRVNTSIDLTQYIGVGNRIRLSQTSNKYFLVTAITSTIITLFGGTDYTLTNSTITAPYFSNIYAPHGFPLNKSKWSVYLSMASVTQVNPNAGTYYNLGGYYLDVPIGDFKIVLNGSVYADRAATNFLNQSLGISTANNALSDTELSGLCFANNTIVIGTIFISKDIINAVKTRYYLVSSTNYTSLTNIRLGTYTGAYIKAISNYV